MSRFLNSALVALTPYTPGEQPQGGTFIKLNTNESPFPPSDGVLNILGRAEAEKLNLYSDPTLNPVTSSLAKRFGVENKNVYAGNGSDEVLAIAMYAFGEKGFSFPDITYGFYNVIADFFRIGCTRPKLRDDFTIDISDYMKNDRAVIIANPNAPTGIFLPLSEIEKILSANPDHVVIVDEAYVEFGGESAASLVSKYENLLVVGTFSKAWNLAGARLGYAVGNSELISDLNRLRCSFHPYNINRLTLLAGQKAVEEEQYYIECRKKIIATRVRVQAELESLGFTCTPSMANFIFARPPMGDAKRIYKALYDKKVLVRYFASGRTKEYLRISVGSDEQMDKFLDALKSIL
ncbi:MAG: histidinol-phosphate transaminase [Clostridia bacterium]|nr:histidinol-phosphate transaminase [Clostridia bacterium]MBQ4619320.1 histidinol-phosphate transaminase [Clostridia bacterium]